MAIKDNRILVDLADSATGWTSIGSGGGAAAAAFDPDVSFDGGGSLTFNATTQVRGWIYNIGAGTYAGNHFYFLLNCGIVGLLNNKSAGGVRARFGTSATTDYIESYIGGKNFYPLSFGGGWSLFVVDIDYAFATYTNSLLGTSAGTVPSGPNAVTFVGLTVQSTSAPSSNKANSWIDNIYRLPPGNAGIIVEGTNSGNPYTFSDVLSYTETNLVPTFRKSFGGSYVSCVPIQIGNTTTSSTHNFDDKNAIILFDNYPNANTNYYYIKLENTSGSTLNVKAGEKSGTGDDASGSQGWTVQSSNFANNVADLGYTIPARWSLYANNNLANVALYGCSFSHADIITFENANSTSEIVTTSFLDCTELVHSSNTQYTIDTGTPLFQRLTVVNANTVDNQAFVKTVNPTNIKFSSFQFSNGHAMEISSLTGFPASTNNFTLTNVGFTGYSTANNNNDSTIFNNTGRAITLNVVGGNLPTVREGTGADTEIKATVAASITNILSGSEVRIYEVVDVNDDFTLVEVYGEENNTSGSVSTTLTAGEAEPGAAKQYLLKILRKDYLMLRANFEVRTSSVNYRADQVRDRVYQAGGS